jgi:hypothetical protein
VVIAGAAGLLLALLLVATARSSSTSASSPATQRPWVLEVREHARRVIGGRESRRRSG